MHNLINRCIAIIFIFTTLSCQVVGKYQWYASFETYFTDKKSKKEITVTNTFSHPSKLPILARRTYSDEREAEYFFLKNFLLEEIAKITADKNNIQQLKYYYEDSLKETNEYIKALMLGTPPNEKDFGIFYLTKNKEENKIYPVMLGVIRQNRQKCKEFNALDKTIPYMEKQLAAWVCADKYMKKKVGRRVPGMIRTAAPIYIQWYIHKHKLKKVKAQAAADANNAKSNAAMASVIKTKHEEEEPITKNGRAKLIKSNYYEGIFEKLEKDDSLGEITTEELIKRIHTVPLNQNYNTEIVVGSICLVCISLGLYALEKIYTLKKKGKKRKAKKNTRKKYWRSKQ